MNIVSEITWCLTVWLLHWIPLSLSSTTQEITKIQPSITSAVHRQIRELSYPEDSEMGIFFALAIPLDDPISTKAISVAFFFEANYQLTKTETNDENSEKNLRKERSTNRKGRPMDRRAIYSMLESKFESLGFPGRACLLRSICETLRNPIHYHNGLLGDLIRILFTPSSSIDEDLSDEYTRAENQLNDMPGDCSTAYSLCPFNIYDYITVR